MNTEERIFNRYYGTNTTEYFRDSKTEAISKWLSGKPTNEFAELYSDWCELNRVTETDVEQCNLARFTQDKADEYTKFTRYFPFADNGDLCDGDSFIIEWNDDCEDYGKVSRIVGYRVPHYVGNRPANVKNWAGFSSQDQAFALDLKTALEILRVNS